MNRFVVEFGKDGTPLPVEGRLDAPAFHRNHAPIWQAIGPVLREAAGSVLELGSGTGQHIMAFAARAPGLTWYPSDVLDSHIASIVAWRAQSGLPNVAEPQRLDLADPAWTWHPGGPLAAMLCINVLHISSWIVSQNLLTGAARHLALEGRLIVYGPFMRDGLHTAPSNAQFDASLRAQNPASGVRDVSDLAVLARSHGLALSTITPMPANNFVLVFTRANRS